MSVAALALSIVALVWGFALTWLKWPRIAVVIRQSAIINVPTIVSIVSMGSPTPSDLQPPAAATGTVADELTFVVLNQGAEATTVANIGIRSEDRSVNLNYEGHRDVFDGPDLPARVEAHGCLVWTIRDDKLTPIPHGTAIVGYAQRFKPIRKYPKRKRNMLRTTETVITTHRNGGTRRIV